MAPPPPAPSPPPLLGEQTGELAAAPPPAAVAAPPEGQRSLPTPFLTKTYQIVDNPSVDDVISWNEDGSAFIVWRPAEFARDLLPKYFKHNNFSSFVRQLNTYGFRKIVPDRWEFANDSFRRGEKQLLCDIHRRKIIPTAAPPAPVAVSAPIPANQIGSPTNSGEEQVLSSNSSPGTAPPPLPPGSGADLVEENERLRRENSKLSCELGKMKRLCNDIYALMSKYSGSGGEEASPAVAELELMPTRSTSEEEPAASPRLFGVSIGMKRVREEEGEDPIRKAKADADVEVKSEPVDQRSDKGREDEGSWVLCCSRPNPKACNGNGNG